MEAGRYVQRRLARLTGKADQDMGVPMTRIENGSAAKQSTIDALRAALEAAGIRFIPGGGAGIRFREAKA